MSKFRVITPEDRHDLATRFAPTREEHAQADASRVVWQHAVEEFQNAETKKRARAIERRDVDISLGLVAAPIGSQMSPTETAVDPDQFRDFVQRLRVAGVDTGVLREQLIASGLSAHL